MDVISGATDSERLVMEVFSDARFLSPQFLRLGNCEHAIFGGEDE